MSCAAHRRGLALTRRRYREFAPQLWQRLPATARRRFLSHLRPYWDVHRHRLPASTAAALHGLQRDGQLQVHAGRILGLEPMGKQVQVRYRPARRSARRPPCLSTGSLTAPDRTTIHADPGTVLRGLLAQGVAIARPVAPGPGDGQPRPADRRAGAAPRAISTTSARCCARATGKAPQPQNCACTPSPWPATCAPRAAVLLRSRPHRAGGAGGRCRSPESDHSAKLQALLRAARRARCPTHPFGVHCRTLGNAEPAA